MQKQYQHITGLSSWSTPKNYANMFEDCIAPEKGMRLCSI